MADLLSIGRTTHLNLSDESLVQQSDAKRAAYAVLEPITSEIISCSAQHFLEMDRYLELTLRNNSDYFRALKYLVRGSAEAISRGFGQWFNDESPYHNLEKAGVLNSARSYVSGVSRNGDMVSSLSIAKQTPSIEFWRMVHCIKTLRDEGSEEIDILQTVRNSQSFYNHFAGMHLDVLRGISNLVVILSEDNPLSQIYDPKKFSLISAREGKKLAFNEGFIEHFLANAGNDIKLKVGAVGCPALKSGAISQVFNFQCLLFEKYLLPIIQ